MQNYTLWWLPPWVGLKIVAKGSQIGPPVVAKGSPDWAALSV